MVSKDNLVFAFAGIILGIILGAVIVNVSAPRMAPVTTTTTTMQQSAPAPAENATQGAEDQGTLPEGHPPIDQRDQTAVKDQIAAQQKVLENDPNNQDAILRLGNLNFDIKNYTEAAKWYEKALQKDPKNVNIITDLGSSYLWMNDSQKAIDYYNKSLSIDPNHFQTLMNLGIARMTMGDRAGAAQAWEKVITLYPDNPQVPMLRDAVKKLRTPQS